MSDNEAKKYQRPNQAPGCGGTPAKEASSIAHTLQCDIEYLLQETNSRSFQPPKHMLDMVLKHIHRELDDIITKLMEVEGKP